MAFSMITVSSQGGPPAPPHSLFAATPLHPGYPPKLVQKSGSSLVFNSSLPPLHPQIPHYRMYTCQCMGM